MGKVLRMRVVVTSMLLIIMLGCKVTKATMDESKVMHVSGKVKCQYCSQGWSEWVQGAKPIKGCKVSVTCLDEHKGVAYYASDATDDEGEFNIIVEKNCHGRELRPKDCIVRMFKSPDQSCNVTTDFGHGTSGVKLRQPSIVYRDITKYVVGPFYYTTPGCEDVPDTTTTTSNQQGSSY